MPNFNTISCLSKFPSALTESGLFFFHAPILTTGCAEQHSCRLQERPRWSRGLGSVRRSLPATHSFAKSPFGLGASAYICKIPVLPGGIGLYCKSSQAKTPISPRGNRHANIETSSNARAIQGEKAELHSSLFGRRIG